MKKLQLLTLLSFTITTLIADTNYIPKPVHDFAKAGYNLRYSPAGKLRNEALDQWAEASNIFDRCEQTTPHQCEELKKLNEDAHKRFSALDTVYGKSEEYAEYKRCQAEYSPYEERSEYSDYVHNYEKNLHRGQACVIGAAGMFAIAGYIFLEIFKKG